MLQSSVQKHQLDQMLTGLATTPGKRKLGRVFCHLDLS